MVAGKFKCFGTGQQIKSKYGKGATIDLKFDLQTIDQKYDNLTQFVYKSIEDVELIIDTSRRET